MIINFNLGEHLHEASNNLIFDLLVTFLSAFLGFLFALYLNRKVENKGKKRSQEILEQNYKDKLKYLTLHLGSVIDVVEKQTLKFKEFSEVVKIHPLEISLPVILATYDIERLKNFSTDGVFEAFTFFKKNNDNRIDDYKSLFSKVDFLYKLSLDFEKQIEKHSLFIHKDQLLIKNILEDLSLIVGLRCKNIINSNSNYKYSQDYKYLHALELKYSELTNGKFNFELCRINYFKFINDTIFADLSEQELADHIFFQAKKALYIMNNIEMNSNKFSDDIGYHDKDIDSAIQFLRKIKVETEKIIN